MNIYQSYNEQLTPQIQSVWEKSHRNYGAQSLEATGTRINFRGTLHG